VGNGGNNFRAAFVKDYDNDGFDDVIATRMYTGIVIRFRGPNGAGGGTLTVPEPIILAINNVGNVTGSPIEDIAAFSWNTSANPSTTHFRLYNGSTGIPAWGIVSNPITFDLFIGGRDAACRLPDLDGDGTLDLAAPSRLPGPGGSTIASGATAISGTTGTLLFSIFTPAPLTGLGSISTIGDVTGDGIAEFAFGYAQYPTGGGHVALVSPVTLPSASTLDLGGSCGAFSTSLSVTPPVIGSIATISVSAGPPSAAALLLLDVAPNVATSFGICTLHLDLAHVSDWLQVPLLLDPTGSAALVANVPSLPTLALQPVTMQVLVPGTASPLGLDLSNGVRATLGF
jgi:hypothetical protein